MPQKNSSLPCYELDYFGPSATVSTARGELRYMEAGTGRDERQAEATIPSIA